MISPCRFRSSLSRLCSILLGTFAVISYAVNCSADTPPLGPCRSALAAPGPEAAPHYQGELIEYLHYRFTRFKSEREHEDQLQNILAQGFQCIGTELDGIQSSVDKLSKVAATDSGAVEKQLQQVAGALGNTAATLRALSSRTRTLRKDQRTELASLRAQISLLESELADVRASSRKSATSVSISLDRGAALEPTPPAATNQMEPAAPILEHYPEPNVAATATIITVPDPRVPRHRRDYDNAIMAISQGMLRNGFVLDRYVFPWRKQLAPGAPISVATGPGTDTLAGSSGGDSGESVQATIEADNRYGLMIYRRDRWRQPGSAVSVELRALYVVPETATYGVEKAALICALRKIDEQMGPQPTAGDSSSKCPTYQSSNSPAELTAHPLARLHGFVSSICSNSAAAADRIEVIGPTYSGSMDSVREAIDQARRDPRLQNIRSYCILSASATSDTNGYAEQGPAVSYHTLATPDSIRIAELWNWANALRIPINASHPAVLLYEATTFGQLACPILGSAAYDRLPDAARKLCANVIRIAFPANIADVRYGLQMQQLKREQELQTAKASAVSWSLNSSLEGTHLPLEEGAENGSEFPESQQSPITAASSEDVLDELMAAIHAQHPGLIIIVATDVRDRLFLMQMLNAFDNHGLIVDLGADNLTAQHDFTYASRGMLALSSVPLTRKEVTLPTTGGGLRTSGRQGCFPTREGAAGVPEKSWCARYEWATEEQALTFVAVRMWNDGPYPYASGRDADGLSVFPHIVTRQGLLSIADVPAPGPIWLVVWGLAGLSVVLLVFVAYVFIGTPVPEAAGRGWYITGGAGVIGLATVLAAAVASLHRSDLSPLTGALGLDAGSGLGYGWVLVVAALAIAGAASMAVHAAGRQTRTDTVLQAALNATGNPNQSSPLGTAGLSLSAIGWSIAALGVIGALWLFFNGERQVTVFGRSADWAAFVALLTVVTLEFVLFVGAEVAAARVTALVRVVATYCDAVGFLYTVPYSVPPKLWSNGGVTQRPTWTATPVLAGILGRPAWFQAIRLNIPVYGGAVTSAFTGQLTPEGLKGLYIMITEEITTYRRSVAWGIICAISAGVMIYLFPISEATPLIAIAASVLLLSGALSTVHILHFENDRMLRNLICNRNRVEQRKWSVGLVAAVLLPFLVLAGLVSLTQLPGVLDSEGGLIRMLINHLPMMGK